MQVDQPWVEVFILSHSQVTPDVDRPARVKGINIIESQSSHT